MAEGEQPEGLDEEFERISLNPDDQRKLSQLEQELDSSDTLAEYFLEAQAQDLGFSPFPQEFDHTDTNFISPTADEFLGTLHGNNDVSLMDLREIAVRERADITTQQQSFDTEHPGYIHQRQILTAVNGYFQSHPDENTVWFSTEPWAEEGVLVELHKNAQEKTPSITRDMAPLLFEKYGRPFFQEAHDEVDSVIRALGGGAISDEPSHRHVSNYVERWKTRLGREANEGISEKAKEHALDSAVVFARLSQKIQPTHAK